MGENSMSKLDNDAKRVANIYMELPKDGLPYIQSNTYLIRREGGKTWFKCVND